MNIKKIFIIACLAVLLLFLYAFLIERHNLQVQNVALTSAKLPEDFPGLRFVQLSDMHIKKLGAYEIKVAQKVNSLRPQFIVITGDFFRTRDIFERAATPEFKQNIDNIAAFLQLLHAEKGIFVCRGNNDFGNDKEVSDQFLQRMKEIGVAVLSNSQRVLRVGGVNIHLLGVDYPEFARDEVADFFIAEYEDGQCLQVNESSRNSYSHFLIGDDRSRWSNYTFTGKFRQSRPDAGGVGVTFYSQFDKGYDRFYRLRRTGGEASFILSPHGAEQPPGDIYVDTNILPDAWYRFKVEVYNLQQATAMRARVWPRQSPEPTTWQATAVDSNATFRNGTVGLWSHGTGMHQFDDLLVVSSTGDTLLSEDFEQGVPLQDPFGWADYNYEREAIPWLMQSVPEDDYAILLSHTPDVINWAEAAAVDLQLSGHTHGGQIQAPFFGALLVRTALGRKYAEGLFQFGRTTLYINRGIGTALAPLRLLCRPEITIFELQNSVLGVDF